MKMSNISHSNKSPSIKRVKIDNPKKSPTNSILDDLELEGGDSFEEIISPE